MKRSASEFGADQPFLSPGLARNFDAGTALELNGFVSDAELFMCPTKCIKYDKVF